MKKLLPFFLCLLMLLSGCARANTLTGSAQGYGGKLTVAVTMNGDTIESVEVMENNETQSVAGEALTRIPADIVAANSADVDAVSGATITSNAIMRAVKNAIGAEAGPEAQELVQTGLSMGFGIASSGRIGPGKDSDGVQVYSVNEVFVCALFDKDGRVVDLTVDQLEFATPNYDGAGMPHFSGYPGQGGYNYDEAHTGTISGKTPDTEDFFLSEINDWKTKRLRGDAYQMGTGTWASQMDAFQRLFIGKTVGEIEDWFSKYCSDVNGRPLKAESADEKDAAKYNALSDADKTMLADVTSSATMSLNDSHGNIIGAIKSAYDNRRPVSSTENNQ